METIGVQIAQVLAVALGLGTFFILVAGAVLLWMSSALREPELKPVYVPVEGGRRRPGAAMNRVSRGSVLGRSELAPSTMLFESDDRGRWNRRA